MKHKHGTKQRKIWRKLHIGVNDDGNIIAGEVTTLRDSDIATVPDLLDQTTTQINTVVGDGAYYKNRMEIISKITITPKIVDLLAHLVTDPKLW